MLPNLAGCGVLWDTGADEQSFPPPEKSTLTIHSLKLTDSIPMLLAKDAGYFEDEGLTVETDFGEKGSVNLEDVMAGTIDIGMTSYPPPITKQLEGARLKVIADAVQTTPGLIQIVVPQNSEIQSVTDLVNKKVANSSPRGITELTLNMQLETRGIDSSKVEYVSMEIAKMPEALANGDVDAAGVAEPFIQSALMAGGVTLFDPFSGPAADFPWSGFLVTEEFAEKYPNTVAAFQRALNRAVEEVRANRTKAEEMAVQYLDVDDEIARLMTMPEYPTKVDPVRLQRVADMLYDSGEIDERLDMSGLVLEETDASS